MKIVKKLKKKLKFTIFYADIYVSGTEGRETEGRETEGRKKIFINKK